MSEFLTVIMNLSVLTFVITSMLSMGLSLTVSKIIAPLRNMRLMILALVANFILMPLIAYLIIIVIPLDQGLAIGLILLATAAGAPFLPKLAQVAKGDMAFSVGLMILLMVGTIIYVPLVLPLLLQGVQVNPLDIATSLVVLMLIPLVIGLGIKARYETVATSLLPHMSHVSSLSLVLLLISGLVLNFSAIVGVIGTGAILSIIIFLVVAVLVGYILGGSEKSIKSVLGLGTAQRNLSAAFLIAVQNFPDDPNVMVMNMVAGIVGLILLMVIAGELGRRSNTKG